MKILYAASEALPYASTGGLADVVGSLPLAVKKELGEGADVRVVIPLYPTIRKKFDHELEMICEMNVKLAWRNQYCGIWQIVKEGVTFYFIDNEYYFNRAALYGSFDDAERFAYFGKAILELMTAVGFYPDVLHANDWQTAPAVIYLKRKYAHLSAYQNIKTLFTIHNIDYQGIYDFSILGDIFELAEWDRSVVEYNGSINLLKGAIVCTDQVSTVSGRYADEILTEYYGSGLHHILRANQNKLCGIVNGIDVDYYAAEKDPEIAANFTADDISGKAACKAELEDTCGFEHKPDAPILAMVSRLASHKGFDLVTRVIEEILLETNLRFALLGTGEFELEDFFTKLAERFPDRVCVKLEYNKSLSKQFYAGADMFLMPSKSEPCGLAQMISSRYGTVPVVRETGGLFDTIRSYNEYTGEGNGFSFTNYNAHEMKNMVEYAVGLYMGRRDEWNDLVKSVMNVDFSWRVSAKKYIDIYTKLQ